MQYQPQRINGHRQRKTALTRENILKAAKEIFLAGGYHETTITKISQKVGVAYGTVYNYFSSKEELLEHILYDEVISKMNDIVFIGLHPANLQEAYTITTRQIRDVLQIVLDNRAILKVVWEAMGQAKDIAELWNSVIQKYVSRVIEDIAHSQDNHLAKNIDRVFAAKSIVYLVERFIWDIALGKETDVSKITETAVEMYLHGVYY